MADVSWIELSRSALQKNIRFLHKLIGKQAAFCSVIKGNAYGHGIEQFVPLVETFGVRRFAVFNAAEARRVHASGTKHSRIMIMGALSADELDWVMKNDISFYIFELDRLKAALQIHKKFKFKARIHLELETGLHRMGLYPRELEKALAIITANPEAFILEGVCTHYAGAESISNHLRIQNQIANYHEMLAKVNRTGLSPKYRHTACSAAVLNYPETILDMVRFGIAQYGYWPTRETRMRYMLQTGKAENKRFRDPLKRIITWKSRVMNIQEVDPGEFVGYGTVFQTGRRSQIAAVPVGYALGFSRLLSNRGHVLICGHRAGVIGIVNMNMLLVDVTNIHRIRVGDEVVLIGKQKNHTITVSSFSEMSEGLNYEILVRLPSDIPRYVVE